MDSRSGSEMRRLSRSLPRALAWAVPLLATTTGAVLASVNTLTIWISRGYESAGVETFAADTIAVWPMGLVLIGVGVLSLTATSLVEMLRAEEASRHPSAG
ncbi:MAG: hypothetical protein K0S37_3495 [Microbacterium sp.]|jgi:hypothetical protein|nr:hypothetical protein [Microbacterium sp.]